ncbi:MAG: phosphotransferase [Actinomycetota bacterium]
MSAIPPADRPLDASIVAHILTDQFAELSASKVVPFGGGWNNDMFLVDDEWLFRFPRREQDVEFFEREVALLPLVGKVIGVRIPVIEKLGAPGPHFPYPFGAYRLITGVASDEAPFLDESFAVELGGALSRLHAMDVSQFPPNPDGEWDTPEDRQRWLLSDVELVRSRTPDDIHDLVEPYLQGSVAVPVDPGLHCVIHNDIGDDHLIVDPSTGRLTGIIDWADMLIGDAARDFVPLVSHGDSLFDRVIRHYDPPVESGFVERVNWMARVLHLCWLRQADPGEDLRKHQVWLRRTFGLHD